MTSLALLLLRERPIFRAYMANGFRWLDPEQVGEMIGSSSSRLNDAVGRGLLSERDGLLSVDDLLRFAGSPSAIAALEPGCCDETVEAMIVEVVGRHPEAMNALQVVGLLRGSAIIDDPLVGSAEGFTDMDLLEVVFRLQDEGLLKRVDRKLRLAK